MLTLVQAIARQEGFDVAGSRAARNHNPGNIDYGVFARLHGAIGADPQGYAIFPDNATGTRALSALLESAAYRNLTLGAAIMRYAPPTGDPRGLNDTAQYIANVSAWTGIGANDGIDRYV